MPLSEGWRDQYNRMLRRKARLDEAVGPSSLGSDEARDRLMEFYVTAFSLLDWLLEDPALKQGSPPPLSERDRRDLLASFKQPGGVMAFSLCGDLANGIKHLVLTRSTKTGDKSTTIDQQSVAVGLPVFESRTEFPGPLQRAADEREAQERAAAVTAVHRWRVTSNGAHWDAVDLANQVVDAWNDWLNAHSLL
ncbi:hypothetical protein [Nonomuraea sp. NPDC049646]|uniref:hypothetical protein n=1 Tax=unclassified Nonomuraea TaxID=2593643 RepID=UPI0037B1D2C9